GKALRYPLCKAALDLWEAGHLVTVAVDAIREWKRNRNEAALLTQQFREAGKPKQAEQAAALLRRYDEVFKEDDAVKWIQSLREMIAWVEARFARESVAALRVGNFAAFKALEQAWKRWEFGSKSDDRKLGMLEALRIEALDEAEDKGGIVERWVE